MKTFKRLCLIAASLFSLTLSGCKLFPKSSSIISSSELSSEISSSEEVSSSEEISSSEESSESSESSSSEEEPEPVYTVESVAGDIGECLGMALSDEGNYWLITLNFSQEGVDYSNTQAEESVLMPVVATLVNYYMPEYLELIGAKYFTPEEDFWEDESGDTAYYAMLAVDEVGVDIVSYCYNGYLLGQIVVYSAAE